MFAHRNTSASNTTQAYYAGLNKVGAAKAADGAAAGTRRFGSNITNQYTRYNVIQQKKSVEKTVEARPRTAGTSTRPSMSGAAAKEIVMNKVDQIIQKAPVKVDDVMIPDAGVDSEYDKKDPQQVTSYVNEVMSHMRQNEVKYMADPNYLETMQKSSGLAKRHRVSIVDWVVEVHRKFKTLRQETLFLAINVMDRFLSNRQVAKDKLQLVGATCLLIASKIEDMWPTLVRDLVYVASKAFTKQDVKKMERTICNAISFQVIVPTLSPFLARFSKAAQFDSTSKELTTYIAELSMHEYNILKYPPSVIAASSVCLAQKMLRRGSWTSALQSTSHYTESSLMPCMRDINVLLKATPAEMKSVKNKYSRVSSTKAVEI
jgi:hypothetical protein